MGHKTTYYTDDEEERIEQLADEKNVSFSKVVRNAIHEVYDNE